MAINLDHVTEQITVTDTATNASLTVQPKGTGAFNIAAGSSGVNLSNGNTVTAVTVTALGSYTSTPTAVISAPTAAGGVQATFSFSMQLATPTIVSGGTGYTVGNILSLVGGTLGSGGYTATVTVSAVSSGVITGITISNFGGYEVVPTGTISLTGGSGSGATITSTWYVRSAFPAPSITNAGSGYVEQPTVTFSGGGGSGAAAFAVVGSQSIIKGIGTSSGTISNQSIMFQTLSGNTFLLRDSNQGTNDAHLMTQGTASGYAIVVAEGSNANASMYVGAKGTGSVRFNTRGTSLVEQMRVSDTASAVNYVQVTGAATGNGVSITSQGSDSDIYLDIKSKGTRPISFYTSASAGPQFKVEHSSSAVNYIAVNGSSTGGAVRVIAAGSDTNIPLVLQPKGTGALQAQQTDSTATGGNARGINAVDWQTSRTAASQVASGQYSVIGGGLGNINNSTAGVIAGGAGNQVGGTYAGVLSGISNIANGFGSAIGAGYTNTAAGFFNFIGTGYTNTGTSGSAVTTQSGTMNGTTAVTLSASNASIKVGQLVIGTSITTFPHTYVAAVSGTSLTLSQVASGSSTSTLSFYTPHGVVVGGGNNIASGSYSFVGAGGDAGNSTNRNVASGDWSVVGGGTKNVASGIGSVIAGGGVEFGTNFGNTANGSSSFIGGGILNIASGIGSAVTGGWQNTANGTLSTVIGGRFGIARSIVGNTVISANNDVFSGGTFGNIQSAILVLGKQTTNATPAVLCSDSGSAANNNQVILPNNSAYFFTGEIVSGVTGGGNTKGWTIEGVIKRGANAASTALVGTPTVTSTYADAGASTWVIAVTADTTNGGLAVTFTGQASTTIRTVAQIRTTEMTY